MGILGEKDYENLGMMSHSIEMFWHVLRKTNGFWWWKCWGMILSPFIKSDGRVRMRYHSNFTVQPQYLNWVGLSRKFICISMGSLVEEVWAEATSWVWIVHLCSAQNGRWPWLGGQAHRGGAYTRVCKGKVMIDYPHTKYDDSGLSLTDVSNSVVKVYHLWRVSNFSNSRVHGHG